MTQGQYYRLLKGDPFALKELGLSVEETAEVLAYASKRRRRMRRLARMLAKAAREKMDQEFWREFNR
jgi:hypothetical protein